MKNPILKIFVALNIIIYSDFGCAATHSSDSLADHLIALTDQFARTAGLKRQQAEVTLSERKLHLLKDVSSDDTWVKTREDFSNSYISDIRKKMEAGLGFLNNKFDYPINLKALSSDLQKIFKEGSHITVSPDEMTKAFDDYTVIPLRHPAHEKLMLGTGNQPTLAAGKVASSHYLDKKLAGIRPTIDAFPDWDTTDISAAMNPTFVADSMASDFVRYLESLGKKYSRIKTHGFETGLPLSEIRKILHPEGVYEPGLLYIIFIKEGPTPLKKDLFDWALGLRLFVSVPEEIYDSLNLDSPIPPLVEYINRVLLPEGFQLIVESEDKLKFLEELSESTLFKDLTMPVISSRGAYLKMLSDDHHHGK